MLHTLMVRGCCRGACAQALQPYRDTAVTESERIEEDFDSLIATLDLDAPFVFHIGLDVPGDVSWKAPYQDIEASALHAWGASN
jgi:hypothetical protein